MMPWNLSVTGHTGRTRGGETDQAIGPQRMGDLPSNAQHPLGVANSGFSRPHSQLRGLVWGPALKQASDGGNILTQVVLRLHVTLGKENGSLS